MARLLENADFAHSAPAYLDEQGQLVFMPWDLSRPEFAWLMRSGKGSIGLTGAAHTLEAYRRLPYGWRTTPAGLPTDRYMWLQWLDLPGFKGVTAERLTHLHLPDHGWRSITEAERAAALADWFRRSREAGFAEELEVALAAAIRRAGEDYRIQERETALLVKAMESTRTWRARSALLRLAPLRALLARRPEAR